VLVPISSTNTSRRASISSATITFPRRPSATLIAFSSAPTVLFSAEAHPFEEPPQEKVRS
jgi:hypothetical protein